VSDVDFDRYRHVVAATYRFHDMLLGTLSALAGPDTTLLLVSDHGFESGGLRQGLDAWASPENWHRRYGIAALAGPRVQPGAALFGASLLDVAPTTLALLGLPIGNDLEGRVWGEALDADFEWETLPSWEQVAGDDGRLSPDAGDDPWDAAAMVRQLVELGYVEDPGADAQAAIRNAERENQVLLARSLVAGRQFARAAEVWASLSAERPDDVRYVLQLARCRLAAGQLDEGRALLERHAPAALAAGHAATLAELALLAGCADQALAYLSAAPDDADATRRVQFAYCRGRAYQQLKRYPEAIAQYRDVLGLQPEHARAHFGLASCALASQDFAQAAELALHAIDLQYWQPQAHLCLGQALVGLARYDDAIAALQVALRMAPQLPQAHYWLAEAYERGPRDMGRAAQHRSLFRSST
jgi:tetratricopeptide (TPR) repeat protein